MPASSATDGSSHPPPFSKFMLTEMMVRVEDMHAPKIPLKCVSLVELYKNKRLKFKTASTIEFHLSFTAPKGHAADLQVQVTVTGNPVSGSPVLITVNHDMTLSVGPQFQDFLRMLGEGDDVCGDGDGAADGAADEKEEDVNDIVGRMRSAFKQTGDAANGEEAWKTVNPGNMTANNRTSGANADMDESDLKSLGVSRRQRNLSRPAEASKENDAGSHGLAVAVNHHVGGVQRAAAVAPLGSPRVTRQIPLDQPSPIATRPTGIAALPVNPNLVNTPIEISTMNVEGLRRNLPVIPEFVAADAGVYDDAPADKSAIEMAATNVRSLSEHLSDGCDADGGMNDTKLGNKSVTFAAYTTIFEKKNNYTCVGETSLIGANPNATLMDVMENGGPHAGRPAGDCSTKCHEVTEPLLPPHLVRTGETKLCDGDQALAKSLMRQQQQRRDVSQISVHTDPDASTASSGLVGASRIWGEMSDQSRMKVKCLININLGYLRSGV